MPGPPHASARYVARDLGGRGEARSEKGPAPGWLHRAHGPRMRPSYGDPANPEAPKWGWRTEYSLADEDHLTITSFNIMPDGQEAKGAETTYQRLR